MKFEELKDELTSVFGANSRSVAALNRCQKGFETDPEADKHADQLLATASKDLGRGPKLR